MSGEPWNRSSDSQACGRWASTTRSPLSTSGGSSWRRAGFLCDSDVYNDEIPYYVRVGSKNHLVVPYTSDCNDFHYWTGKFNTSESFFQYLKDSFDVLYREGEKNPKMMSVGTHVRISSKPGRIVALQKFIEYSKSHQDVWFGRRDEIAR